MSGIARISVWVFRQYSFSVHSTTHFQHFRRFPTKLEWARFRGYTRRMRHLQGYYSESLPPSQALLVLQFCTVGEPLLPNLKSLSLPFVTEDFAPFIPSFLSPRTTCIDLKFRSDFPEAVVASVVATFPALCPNLRNIVLFSIPSGPMVTAAISGLLLGPNRNTIQQFQVDSPLTEEASEVICKLPSLRELRVTINRPALPTLVLPNLTEIAIDYDQDHGWLQGFRGATLGKLTFVLFSCSSRPIGDFLEAFESVALTTSIPATLSEFVFCTKSAWKPNYRSLLRFRQLTRIVVDFTCDHGCSSTIDDDIITDLARTMPKLEQLELGDGPCGARTGVTAKGLAAVAYYCPRLTDFCVHFQVAGLDPSKIPRFTPGDEPTSPREDCVLRCLPVGDIYVPEDSILMVALTLLRIFPRLDNIMYCDQSWEKVAHAVRVSKKLVDHSSKKHSFDAARRNVDDTPFRSYT